MELTATGHLQAFAAVYVFDADADVDHGLVLETFANVARSEEATPVFSGERAGAVREKHRDGGLVDLDQGQRFGPFGGRQGIADVDVLDPSDGNDIAGE